MPALPPSAPRVAPAVSVPRGQYTLPPLPYAVDALEPHVDARTMEIHHGAHHGGYVSRLNAAVAGTPHAHTPVEALIAGLRALPAAMQAPVRDNGGGHANHSLFWSVMAPAGQGGGGEPGGALGDAIRRDLGGLAAFRQAFTQAALTRFGSGWAWLVVDAGGRLAVESSANQDSPLMRGVGSGATPVLGLDVWEHAYYLRYQNRRPDYIAAFYNIICWPEVARRFSAATQAA